MKIVISPAKTLDFETKLPTRKHSQPAFLDKAEIVHESLKDKSPAELSELMDISDKLADLKTGSATRNGHCRLLQKMQGRQSMLLMVMYM
jgi:cytoplasmic iron level regulating protein YaaA (DUF328/UPF0246 family)